MAYIGNTPDITTFSIGVDRFSGTGACTEFTLTRNIDDSKAIDVSVAGIQQDPLGAYTVSNGLLTFTTPPSSATNNIVVTFRAPNLITFNQVTSSQIQAASVVETKIASDAITNSKIKNFEILGNKLGTKSISGNNLGISSISANNFAGGGITSNVFSSNLELSLLRTRETTNVFSAVGAAGNINLDVVSSTVYLFTANSTANMSFNLRANTQNTFDSVTNIGDTTSIACAVKQGPTRFTANLNIDGTLQPTFFSNNNAPRFASISNQEIEVFSYSVIKTAANTYTVLSSQISYGQG